MKWALAMLTAAASTQGSVPLPLASSGKWIVEGQDNMCVLMHAYGEGKEQVTLGFRPWPTTRVMDVILFTTEIDPSVRRGTGTLTLQPGDLSAQGAYVGYGLKTGGRRLTRFKIGRGMLDHLQTAKVATVRLDGKSVSVVPAEMTKAMPVLRYCEQALEKSLGIDPSVAAGIVQPATPATSPGHWFSRADYPEEAVGGGAEGRTNLLLTISVEGRVSACVPFGSSGNATLDKAACSAFLRRGRYHPALDKDGKPLVSYLTDEVGWQLGW